MTIVDPIEDIIARRGAEACLGEDVTQAQHTLQAATRTERGGGSDAMVAAALLHDIGHFIGEFGQDYIEKGVDNRHEDAGAAILELWFPPEVVEPVRLHVTTKRYLCATDSSCFGKLPEASVGTLALQGGPMVTEEVAAFERNRHRDIAVEVRLWDERAKDPEMATSDFGRLRLVLEQLARAA
ncbi:MAG TPA: HD domain-containing protein [Geminicoccaceae bacterium]|nr:HD domain-containing protein [Geminicoccus sp.]HMU50741.1 HD domain-containing protein [Geminicoccaceae bacterium]